MKLLLANGNRTATAPVTAYSRIDLRVPALLAKKALAEIGRVEAAFLDGQPVVVSVRPDGALAVEIA
jgi:hypothetical protein